jgi:hypothetical protein
LARLSDVLVFSAAIPGQGGVSHINEQWQSWWLSKFAARGYDAFDVIRPVIWHREDVEWWYRQNALLYARKGCPEHARLVEGNPSPQLVDLVHPQLYNAKVSEIRRVHESPDGRFLWQTIRRWLFSR